MSSSYAAKRLSFGITKKYDSKKTFSSKNCLYNLNNEKNPIVKQNKSSMKSFEKSAYAISATYNQINESGPIKIKIKKIKNCKIPNKKDLPLSKRKKKSSKTKSTALNDAIKKKYHKPKHLRKNIRKILKEDELDDDIKNAHQAEIERLKRISEKEKISDVIPSLKEIKESSPKLLDFDFSPVTSDITIPTLEFDSNFTSIKEELHPADLNESIKSETAIEWLQPKGIASNSAWSDFSTADNLADLIQKSAAPTLEGLNHLDGDSPMIDYKESCSISSLNYRSGTSCTDPILVDDSDEEMPCLSKEDADINDGDEDYQKDLLNVPDEQGRFLINRGHPPNESDFYLHQNIASYVKPHQISGMHFLYDNVVESVELFRNSPGFGCILAHCMGLGKTVQVVSFLDILFRCVGAGSALLVVPINTIQNWQNEFDMWLPTSSSPDDIVESESTATTQSNVPTSTPDQIDENQPGRESSSARSFTLHVIGESTKSVESRHQVICNWKSHGGVLLIGYEMFRLLVNKHTGHQKKMKKSSMKPNISSLNDFNFSSLFDQETDSRKNSDPQLQESKNQIFQDFYEALIDPGPEVIICDEGHRIKNSEASISKALKSIKTRRRIVMTGYPLQNNLIEYWCMVDFVRPNYLGSKTHFVNMFQRPIENGQCQNSTPEDRKLMQGRAIILHELLNGFVHRRSQAVLKASLPEKEEIVLLVKMSSQQRALYSAMMDNLQTTKAGVFPIESGNYTGFIGSNTLKTYAVCCKIWNHPDILWRAAHNHLFDTFDFDIEDSISSSPRSLSTANQYKPTQNAKLNKARKKNSSQNLTDLLHSNLSEIDNTNQVSTNQGISYEWTHKANVWPHYKPMVEEHGAKIPILLNLIEESIEADDKILLFSQSLLSLDVLELFLKQTRLPLRLSNELSNNGDSTQTFWSRNKTYYRLDGSTSASERERLIQSFNQTDNPAKLFLLSTRAGCLGVNLVGANRVIVLDASWNPCHDSQAVCRVYRYGQTKRCFIYRLVTDNTMEKKIYDRQVAKQSVSDRVVDESNPDQHLMRSDVEQLLQYEDKDLPSITEQDIESEQYKLLSDPVLAKTLHKHKQWVTKMPFSHESLLIDRKDYRLTRTEKKLARERFNYENKHSIGNATSRRAYGVQSSTTSIAPPIRPPSSILSSTRSESMIGLSPHLFSSSSSLADLLSSTDGEAPDVDITAHSFLNGNRTGNNYFSQDHGRHIHNYSSKPPSVQYQLIKQTVVSKDFILTTGPVTLGNSTPRRRIFKGETLELVNTPKGKCIRLPRTGEIFISNSHTNALISDWSEQKTNNSRSSNSGYFDYINQIANPIISRPTNLTDLLRDDSDCTSNLSKTDSSLPDTVSFNDNINNMEMDSLFTSPLKPNDLSYFKPSIRSFPIMESSNSTSSLPNLQTNLISSCCPCKESYFKNSNCTCLCHSSSESNLLPPVESSFNPDNTPSSIYTPPLSLFEMYHPTSSMSGSYNNFSIGNPGSSTFHNNMPYMQSSDGLLPVSSNMFDNLPEMNFDDASLDTNDDIFAPLSPDLSSYVRKNISESSFMDLTG